MTIRLYGDKTINRIVSRLPAVRDAVKDHADQIGRRAEARLAAHRDAGATRVGVDHSGQIDSVVYLDDERGAKAALSIEFGHTDPRTGRHVEGLYVLYGAAGLL
ncbi:DUF5403 family protein [Pseudonocardia hydrocarbonoxydans]|uniref:DUF5403 family protein n=1 Tax=Pseudonocardia hydrocarbonoxydans TaxID=76726 RepID=UPI001C3FA92F|nr:DUF5403 family protein [Pseudonocardia hydrocarbonoxydans]